MRKTRIGITWLACTLLAVATANAAIQATSVEIRGTAANQTAIAGGFNLSNASTAGANDKPVWTPQSFPGFFYDNDNDLGSEQLSILFISGRTIPRDKLVYSTRTQGKKLEVVDKAFTDTANATAAQNAANAGLEKFGAGDMATDEGMYSIVGWQAEKYVGIKNKPNKLAKLLIEDGNAASEKKTLAVGETWDIGGGWSLKAESIDAKATPRQIWLTLSKDGVKKDDKVVTQGKVYTYLEKSIGSESNVPLFVTYIASVFAGASGDLVQLRYTWAIDTSITEIKSGDEFGVFKVQSITPSIQLNNTDSAVTLNKNAEVDLMGNLKFRVADSDDVRIYPKVDYEFQSAVIPTGTTTESGAATANSTQKQADDTTVVKTTSSPTPVQTTKVETGSRQLAAPIQEAPGFEALFAIVGLLFVVYFVLRTR